MSIRLISACPSKPLTLFREGDSGIEPTGRTLTFYNVRVNGMVDVFRDARKSQSAAPVTSQGTGRPRRFAPFFRPVKDIEIGAQSDAAHDWTKTETPTDYRQMESKGDHRSACAIIYPGSMRLTS